MPFLDTLKRSTASSAERFVDEVRFRLEGSPVITIRVYEDLLEERAEMKYLFDQSHFIQTPGQAGPYTTSRRWAESPDLAIKAAISTITAYYDPAVRDGKTPVDEWFKPNSRFGDHLAE